RDRDCRIALRVLERLTSRLPFTLPAEHLVTRDGETCERSAHEVRDHAEVFRDDLGARLAEDGQHPLAEPHLVLLGSGHELRVTAVDRTEVRSIETNEWIDAVAVVLVG